MVDGVVVHPVADSEHRIVEPGGFGPLEPHARVARDVDDQTARGEPLQVLSAQVGHRRVHVLEGAVDNDVVCPEEDRKRDVTVRGGHRAEVGWTAVGVELGDVSAVDR